MVYKVAIYQSDEGYSVPCPAFRAAAHKEQPRLKALANIVDAIREYLEVATELASEIDAREVEVVV